MTKRNRGGGKRGRGIKRNEEGKMGKRELDKEMKMSRGREKELGERRRWRGTKDKEVKYIYINLKMGRGGSSCLKEG